MPWIPACDASSIPDGYAFVAEVDGVEVALCRAAGAYYAVADVCSHDDGPLGEGEVRGTRIVCPRHGAEFDITNGKALTLPAVRPIKAYEARLVDGRVEVNIP